MKQTKLTMAMVTVVIVATIIISGCNNQKATEKPVSDNVSKAENAKEFSIIAKKFEFVPNEIVVNHGDKVILHVKSVDVTHGFAIVDYDINEMLNPGEEVNVTFVADKKGEFSFFCSVPCGNGHNAMQGKLIVR